MTMTALTLSHKHYHPKLRSLVEIPILADLSEWPGPPGAPEAPPGLPDAPGLPGLPGLPGRPPALISLPSDRLTPDKCVCVKKLTCPKPEPSGIDIRIVNEVCKPGFEKCCVPIPPPTPPIECGQRRDVGVTIEAEDGDARYGDYPWQAAIMHNKTEDYIGGGVLIDDIYVLTAAHKVADFAKKPTNIKVRMGEWDLKSKKEPFGAVDIVVVEIMIHEKYDPNNLNNDVAILRLGASYSKYLPKYPNINTACLPEPGSPIKSDQQCFVSGWGKKLFDEKQPHRRILREVDVPIVDADDCESSLRKTRLGRMFELNRESFICAGGEWGKDACTNDGGSPLVCKRGSGQWEVVGLVAWGIGCASPNIPGVYVNVASYVKWIKEVTKLQRNFISFLKRIKV
ncbi:hypothetical protein QAD02_019236 [Eretmocerus hayati]|uniref:Uncharacterized protein n=1 Tax=Eretmocerus hayati TaxID=131215 RepID=A0ACC2PJG6_9HYME|nr:hypothetical protein QAD02_019236 [Eretmocerus hayati]